MNIIKKRRFEQEFTQIDVFKKTEIWPSRLSLIENDHVVPTKQERKRLARILGIRIRKNSRQTGRNNDSVTSD